MSERLESEFLLQLKDTPGLSRLDQMGASAQQKQIGKKGDADGFFDALLLAGDLMLAQPQGTFEFPHQQFDGPPSLIDEQDLSGGQLGQIGHDEFSVFRAEVTPFLTENHRGVSDMTQRQVLSIGPEGFPSFAFDQVWDPGALIVFVR